MEETTVDSDSRAWIPVSAELAAKIAALTALLAELHPEDEPTAHYALGYAVQSGLIAVREDVTRRSQSVDQTSARPSLRPAPSPFRTLANPRATASVGGA